MHDRQPHRPGLPGGRGADGRDRKTVDDRFKLPVPPSRDPTLAAFRDEKRVRLPIPRQAKRLIESTREHFHHRAFGLRLLVVRLFQHGDRHPGRRRQLIRRVSRGGGRARNSQPRFRGGHVGRQTRNPSESDGGPQTSYEAGPPIAPSSPREPVTHGGDSPEKRSGQGFAPSEPTWPITGELRTRRFYPRDAASTRYRPIRSRGIPDGRDRRRMASRAPVGR